MTESTITQVAPEDRVSSPRSDPSHAPSRDRRPARSKFQVLFPWTAIALICIYALQLGLHLRATSVTYDEPVTMLAGYHQWKCGDYSINSENPPLVKYVAAFPLRSQQLVGPDPLCSSHFTTKFDEYVQSMRFLITNGVDRIVIPTRIATSAFSILLAVLMLFAARRMFGEAEALLALAILAFEPVMIAHGSLATMDMAPTTFFFGAVFALYLFWEKPNPLRTVAIGLSLGGMLASKHSALAAIIFLWALAVVMAWLDSRKAPEPTAAFVASAQRGAIAMAVATAIGFACLWASYGFHFYAIPSQRHQTLPITALPMGTGGVPAMIATVTTWGRAARVLPEAYLFGITDVLRQNILHATYLFGHTYTHGIWYYFPVAFSAKTSLPLLILLTASILALMRYREHAREMAFLLIPAGLYFAFSLASGLNIGVRHILPIYPLIIAAAAAGACSIARRMPKAWIAIVALLVLAGVDSARTFPNYISFSNELWGGTNNTYKVLSDSNTDWGQNLKQIRWYIAQHHIQQCWFAETGTPDIAVATLPCHLLPAPYQWLDHPTEDIPSHVSGTVFLTTEALPAENPGMYEKIVSTKPTAFIGGTTFVYSGSFDLTAAAIILHSVNSRFYYQHGRLAEAILEMRSVIVLDPGDPRSHFALGMYLTAANQNDGARDEFNECIKLATQQPDGASLRAVAEEQLQKIH